MIAENGMSAVTVSKDALLKTLIENQATHSAEYKEARAGYELRFIEEAKEESSACGGEEGVQFVHQSRGPRRSHQGLREDHPHAADERERQHHHHAIRIHAVRTRRVELEGTYHGRQFGLLDGEGSPMNVAPTLPRQPPYLQGEGVA
jgi:hypothetical protein